MPRLPLALAALALVLAGPPLMAQAPLMAQEAAKPAAAAPSGAGSAGPADQRIREAVERLTGR
jgi:hypothetical protein